MTDSFILTVEYAGEPQDFAAELILHGYSHQFKVNVHETEVFFEPDEEGSYRAIRMPWQEEGALAKIDKRLLGSIQEKISAILAG